MSLNKIYKQVLDKQYYQRRELIDHSKIQVQQSKIQGQIQQKHSQSTQNKVLLLQTQNTHNVQNGGEILTQKSDINLSQSKKPANLQQKNIQTNTIVQKLLSLESKWIQKQNQIKQYVRKLEKTIQEKNLGIEKGQLQKQKLAYKLKLSWQQNKQIMLRFNQTHQNLIKLQRQKINQQISKNLNNQQNKNLEDEYQSELSRSGNKTQKADQQQKNKLTKYKLQYQQVKVEPKVLKEEIRQTQSVINKTKDQARHSKKEVIQDTQVIDEVTKMREEPIKSAKVHKVQKQDKDQDPRNIEAEIMSSRMKIQDRNQVQYPSSSYYQHCQQKQSDYEFSRGKRHLRITASTQGTVHQKPRGSFVKKHAGPTVEEQVQESFLDIEQDSNRINSYKSAKTITFIHQSQRQNDRIGKESSNAFSSNKITFSPKVKNQDEQRQTPVNKNKQKGKTSINSQVLSLLTSGYTYQNEALNKNKLKQSNEDYQLSQSLVSASQLNYSRLSYNKNYQIKEDLEQVESQDFKQKQEKYKITQVKQDQTKVSNHKRSPRDSNIGNQNNAAEQPNSNWFFVDTKLRNGNLINGSIINGNLINGNLINGSLINQKTITNQDPLNKQNQDYTTENPKQQKNQENCKMKVPEIVPQIINQNLNDTQCKINRMQRKIPDFQVKRKMNKQIQTTFSIAVSSGQKNKQNNSKLDQNCSYFENTQFKKPQYFKKQENSEETHVKRNRQNSLQSQEQQYYHQEKKQLFVNPQTKCTSFQDTSCGNNFFLENSALSEDASMSLNFSSQLKKANSQLKHKNNGSNVNTLNLQKIQFQNQMLHSYNNTLQKQVKAQSKTQKLMEKFKTQNNSLLNKINNRKSIF